LLLELKSRALSPLLLLKLTNSAEVELKSYIGKRQILFVVKFLKQFLQENPLCVCYDEILNIKKHLSENNSRSQLKLKQKSAEVQLIIVEENYSFKVRIKVPEEYHTNPIT